MATKELPSIEMLCKLIKYEPETGECIWLPRTECMFTDGYHSRSHRLNRWNSRHAGKPVGSINPKTGYTTCTIWGIQFLVHRLVWAIHYGQYLSPKDFIDHINHNRSDNSIKNLRVVDQLGNSKNQSLKSNNSSGFFGVWLDRRSNNWIAGITINKKRKYLGGFKSKDDAIKARLEAEKNAGFHKNHGSISTL